MTHAEAKILSTFVLRGKVCSVKLAFDKRTPLVRETTLTRRSLEQFCRRARTAQKRR